MRRVLLRPHMCQQRCRSWGLCVPVTAWWPLRTTLPMRLRAALMAAMSRWWARHPSRRLSPRPRTSMLRLMPRGRTCGGLSTLSAGLVCVCPICVRWVGRRVRPVRCSWWITRWLASLGAIHCVWVPCCRLRRSIVYAPVMLRASWLPYRSRARSSSAIVRMLLPSACMRCLRAAVLYHSTFLLRGPTCSSTGCPRLTSACGHISTARVRWPSTWLRTRWCATCAIPG